MAAGIAEYMGSAVHDPVVQRIKSRLGLIRHRKQGPVEAGATRPGMNGRADFVRKKNAGQFRLHFTTMAIVLAVLAIIDLVAVLLVRITRTLVLVSVVLAVTVLMVIPVTSFVRAMAATGTGRLGIRTAVLIGAASLILIPRARGLRRGLLTRQKRRVHLSGLR